MRFYVKLQVDGIALGPYSIEKIRAKLQTGAVRKDDLICQEGHQDWKTIGEFIGAQAPQSALSSAPITPFTSDYLEITWDRVLVLWWGYTWRMTAFGFVLGVMLCFFGISLADLAGYPELGRAFAILLSWLGSIPLSIVVLRLVLRKKFGEFSVCLVRNQ